MYHNNIVTNKDGQIQTLRDQIQHLSGSESREEWFRSADKLADQRADAIKLQITSEARTQLSDVESQAKLEVDRLRDHLNRVETTASNLQNELSEARKESHGMLAACPSIWPLGTAREKRRTKRGRHYLRPGRLSPLRRLGTRSQNSRGALAIGSDTTGMRHRRSLTN